MKPFSLLMTLIFAGACAATKLPPVPIQDSKWCAVETCDAVLFITGLVIGPDGREVGGEPLIMRWRMPMARCLAELDYPANHWEGPIGNLPGYSRSNNAWCEPYSSSHPA